MRTWEKLTMSFLGSASGRTFGDFSFAFDVRGLSYEQRNDSIGLGVWIPRQKERKIDFEGIACDFYPNFIDSIKNFSLKSSFSRFS